MYEFKYSKEMIEWYFNCIGNKKLLNQFRKEHPRYYLWAKRFWHSKDHIEAFLKKQRQVYFQRKKINQRNYRRIHGLHTINGKIINGLNKRPCPNFCEICGKTQLFYLKYHHWDKKHPNMGIWVCQPCHSFAEAYDKGYGATYLWKKEQISTVENHHR